ncbi:MAG: mannose-6-phosphate isomerase, class I [Chitinophagaceae bacterium]|nr:MAG: mannose-6-phosphate isomerase, class I [Chitinophagaceae bacterium]
MKNTNNIYKLEGRIQHYAWGGFGFLPELLQVPNVGNKPFAEYWMGAHSKAPSLITLHNGEKILLDEYLGESNADLLGGNTVKHFSRLPYLFKILDVKDMLSIQVHPTKENAVLEFEAENKTGISIDDPKRNYKDDNHKPELMYALSDFWLLHGFKTAEKLKNILAAIPEFNFLQPVFEKEGYAGLYRFVMELPQDEVNNKLQPLLDRIVPLYEKEMLPKSDESFWAARAAITFNEPGRIDRGIFSIYIFNLVNLQQGEAIFQDAGIPHAYLEGQNVEIMANSDNVLRGGLTPKHIDVPELLKHTKCEALVPVVIAGKASGNEDELVFLTPAADFELRLIDVAAPGTVQIPVKTADIFFVYSGRVRVGGTAGFDREAGEAFLATNGAEVSITSTVNAIIFRATVPGA